MKKFSASRDGKLANESSVLYVVIGILFLFFLLSCTSDTTTDQKEKTSQVSDSFPTNAPNKILPSQNKKNTYLSKS